MGVNPSAQDIDGESVLHKACFHGCDSVVSILLEAGATPHMLTTETMETPLHYAARRGNQVIADLLIKAGGLRSIGSFGTPESVARESGFSGLGDWLETHAELVTPDQIFLRGSADVDDEMLYEMQMGGNKERGEVDLRENTVDKTNDKEEEKTVEKHQKGERKDERNGEKEDTRGQGNESDSSKGLLKIRRLGQKTEQKNRSQTIKKRSAKSPELQHPLMVEEEEDIAELKNTFNLLDSELLLSKTKVREVARRNSHSRIKSDGRIGDSSLPTIQRKTNPPEAAVEPTSREVVQRTPRSRRRKMVSFLTSDDMTERARRSHSSEFSPHGSPPPSPPTLASSSPSISSLLSPSSISPPPASTSPQSSSPSPRRSSSASPQPPSPLQPFLSSPISSHSSSPLPSTDSTPPLVSTIPTRPVQFPSQLKTSLSVPDGFSRAGKSRSLSSKESQALMAGLMFDPTNRPLKLTPDTPMQFGRAPAFSREYAQLLEKEGNQERTWSHDLRHAESMGDITRRTGRGKQKGREHSASHHVFKWMLVRVLSRLFSFFPFYSLILF